MRDIEIGRDAEVIVVSKNGSHHTGPGEVVLGVDESATTVES